MRTVRIWDIPVEKQLMDQQQFSRPIAVPTIPAEGIPFNTRNYRMTGTSPSHYLLRSSLYLLPALCPHIPRVFGNAETPDQEGLERVLNNAAKSWKVGTIVGKVPGFSPPSEKSTSFDRGTLIYAPCIAPVALTVLAHLVLTIVAHFALTFLAFRKQ